jgi:hypothetical protein
MRRQTQRPAGRVFDMGHLLQTLLFVFLAGTDLAVVLWNAHLPA